jgi:hypothetical protein
MLSNYYNITIMDYKTQKDKIISELRTVSVHISFIHCRHVTRQRVDHTYIEFSARVPLHLPSCCCSYKLNFTGTKQITDALCPLLEAISSFAKKHLTFLFNELAKANTVKEKGEWVNYIELILSYALGPPLTFKHHSAATRFMSMLREGSTSTLNKVKALMDEHEPLVQEMGQDCDGVPISTNDDSGSEDTGSPVHIDNLGQDSDRMSSSIASDPSDQSAMSTES